MNLVPKCTIKYCHKILIRNKLSLSSIPFAELTNFNTLFYSSLQQQQKLVPMKITASFRRFGWLQKHHARAIFRFHRAIEVPHYFGGRTTVPLTSLYLSPADQVLLFYGETSGCFRGTQINQLHFFRRLSALISDLSDCFARCLHCCVVEYRRWEIHRLGHLWIGTMLDSVYNSYKIYQQLLCHSMKSLFQQSKPSYQSI